MAIKCAGDWGQVERCALTGSVFATSDRLAAVYAHHRGVPCVYMHTTHVDDDGRDDCQPPELVRFSFALLRPRPTG